MSYIGERVLRKEDERLLRGQGRYIADIVLPGMLHAAFVRSVHANARVLDIDASALRLMESSDVEGHRVVSVVTAKDLGDPSHAFPIIPPHPALNGKNCGVLVTDRCRYVGEGIAVVVAQSRAAAESARDRVEVQYEPLPSAQSLGVDVAPAVHEDIPSNLAGRVTLSHGSVDAALQAAPKRLSERIEIRRGGGQPIETRGVVADYSEATGLLTVWAASQVTHQIRQFICEMTGLAAHRVRVLAPDVGGGFGAKLIVYPEDVLIPMLAYRLGRPVRWVEDRVEHMLTATQERAQVHNVEVGFDDDGRLLALKDHFVHDNGAYTPRGLVVPLLSASMLPGPYRIPDIEVTLESIYTNRVPVTPYRGAGQPQAIFVMERIIDRIAQVVGRDPSEVRFANLVRPDEMPYDVGITNYRNAGTVIYDSGDYPAVLQGVLDAANYTELQAQCAAARTSGLARGVGVACHVELTGVGPFEGARTHIDAAGRITVFTGVTSQGQGLETTLAQIAANELGVTPSDIDVVAGDTLGIDQGVGTFASRAAVVGGSAVALSARDVRVKARQVAARLLDVDDADIEQDGGDFYRRGMTNYRLSYGELAAAAAMATADHGIDPGLDVTRYFQPQDITYSSGAHVALVEVDLDTAATKVLGYWVCHDSGPAINPTVVEGQLHGAIALGIGSALLEEVIYDREGQQLSASFMDYAMPRADEIPTFHLEHIETKAPGNPLGIKGVGESGTLPVPAVIAAAVDNALSEKGTFVRAMPLTRRRLHNLIRQPLLP